MHRTLVVAASVLALASSGRTASAQDRPIRDSVVHSAAETAPVVDTASREAKLTARDRMLANCPGRALSPIGYVLPTFCAQRSDFLFSRTRFDSVSIAHDGREYQVAARNADGTDLLNRQRKSHALAGALIGGGAGLVGGALIGANDHRSPQSHHVATALTLGGLGALVGGFTGSRYWGSWPRVLQHAQR
jgi:hypothetical protein